MGLVHLDVDSNQKKLSEGFVCHSYEPFIWCNVGSAPGLIKEATVTKCINNTSSLRDWMLTLSHTA